MEKPKPPPEGLLLKAAMDAQRRSIREVARRMDLSEARLRNILNGYQSAGRGQFNTVVAPAERIAGLAYNLRVSPDDVRAAGRADAADFMEKMAAMSDQDEQRRDAWLDWAERPWTSPPPEDLLEEFETEMLLREFARRLLGVRGPEIVDLATRQEGAESEAP